VLAATSAIESKVYFLIYGFSEMSRSTSFPICGMASRLVGRATANPISHPERNAMGKTVDHPTCTKTIVKVITVSNTNVMKKALRTLENLAFTLTTDTS